MARARITLSSCRIGSCGTRRRRARSSPSGACRSSCSRARSCRRTAATPGTCGAIRARRSAGLETDRGFARRAVDSPVSISKRPQMALSSVVLPAPFGPMIPMILPGGNAMLMSDSACTPPNDTDSPSLRAARSWSGLRRGFGGAAASPPAAVVHPLTPARRDAAQERDNPVRLEQHEANSRAPNTISIENLNSRTSSRTSTMRMPPMTEPAIEATPPHRPRRRAAAPSDGRRSSRARRSRACRHRARRRPRRRSRITRTRAPCSAGDRRQATVPRCRGRAARRRRARCATGRYCARAPSRARMQQISSR